MAFSNPTALVKKYFIIGFLCLAILLTSVSGNRVAEIPPGGTLLYIGQCNDDKDCTQLCKSKGELTKFGVECRKHIPPHQPGPPNDCYCKE